MFKLERVHVVVKRFTQDRTHTVEKIGKTQSLTREGFLLCEGVPLARTGTLLYGPGETPLEVGKDGIVRVERDEKEVFRPETLASFEGKPVTLEHPDEEVDPENFKKYVVGIVQNVRRGEGIDNDLVLGDLLIHDKEAIDAIRDGLREVSCGYDADYEPTEPGRGRQLNIMGNHVALVESGRCGSRCSIQDRSLEMKSKKKTTWDALLQRAFKAKDAKELEEIVKDAEGLEQGETETGTHVHLHMGDKPDATSEDAEEGEGAEGKKKTEDDPMTKMLDMMSKMYDKMCGTDDDAGTEAKEDEGDEAPDEKEEKKQAKDTAARLEILTPGAKLPTRDAKTDRKKFLDAVCACKRKALDAALDEHEAVLKPLLGSLDLKKVARPTVDALFIAASELVKAKNNAAGAKGKQGKTSDNVAKGPSSIEDINKRNSEFWGGRNAATH